MIKTIIFDSGGVLNSDQNLWSSNFKKILKITGLPFKEVDRIGNLYWININLGKEKLSIIWKEIIKKSHKKIKISDLNNIYYKGISVNKDVLSLAKKLKKEGFNMVILSNESKIGMRMKIRKFKLNDLFSKIYCTADLGLAKPNKKAFKYVLNDLKQKPCEIIFVDDRKENINTANILGINSIQFNNIKQLKKEIRKLVI